MENILTVHDGTAGRGEFAANEEPCPSQEEERPIRRDKEAESLDLQGSTRGRDFSKTELQENKKIEVEEIQGCW